MKKKFILIPLLKLSFIPVFGQQIKLGEDAFVIKQLIEWSTNERSGYDSSGNSKGNNVEWDVKYYDGKISEVIQCYYNQVLYDLKVRTTYCNHYIMSKGKLSYVLTQYRDLSVSELKKKYDNLYLDSKVEDFYLSDDFKAYNKIYLHKNGLATVEWRNLDTNKLSNSSKTKIKTLKEVSEKKQIEEKQKREKIQYLESKYFDITEYDTLYISKIYPKIETLAIENVFEDLKIREGEQKQIREQFILTLKASKNNTSSLGAHVRNRNQETPEFFPNILYNLNLKMPVIKEQYQDKVYELNRFIEINLNYDLIVGIVNVKKKKTIIDVLNNPTFSHEYKKAIEDLLKNEDNGIYQIKYQFGLVNNTDAVKLVAKKIK